MRKIAVIPKGEKERLLFDEKGFEKFFGVHYLPHIEFDNWAIEQEVKHSCRRSVKKERVGALAEWLGKLHARALEAGSIPAITLREVHPVIGYGVIAEESLSPWQFVGEYAGILRRRSLFFPRAQRLLFRLPARLCKF